MTDATVYSAREYLRLVFSDSVTRVGIATLAVGCVVVVVSSPGFDGPVSAPLVGGGLVLLGTMLFAVGYTRAQWALRERARGHEDDRAQREESGRVHGRSKNE